MTHMIICLFSLLILFHPKEDYLKAAYSQITSGNYEENTKNSISAMEGLDLVKERYAANFEKEFDKNTKEYYYKLPGEDYYLTYEASSETDQTYLYHLYEYVLDEPDTGMGHAVTYGWYSVNKLSGVIMDQTQ